MISPADWLPPGWFARASIRFRCCWSTRFGSMAGRPTWFATKPVELAQDWAQESITGQRAAEKQNRTDLLPPLPLWKMAERFVSGMFKGITPLYLLAVVGGIAAWRRPVYGMPRVFNRYNSHGCQPCSSRRYRALAYAAALILAAIWVHLYWSHEAGPRYFFPIVLMAAPLAGWGFLQISAAVGQSRPQAFGPQTALLAGAAPLAAMLVVNLSVAWGGDVRARAATVDLGHWVQAHYGPAQECSGRTASRKS